MKIKITKPVYMFPQIPVGNIYEAEEDIDGDFVFDLGGLKIRVYPEECEVVEEGQTNYFEALFKELSRLGCYDIKFEKDSKFHNDFTEWSREVVSQIQIKVDKPLPNYLVTGAKMRGINVEVVDRELLKESAEKVVVNGIGRDDRGDLVATIEPKEELYKITFVDRETELPFVGKGSPRLEEKDIFITSPDGHQSVVDRSKFQFFTIEPYIID